jgi:immunoglobulin-binding protein 1
MERAERQKNAPVGPRRIKQLEDDGDEDDAELVDKAAYLDRDWDNFKDENPKGSGNKANKRF